MAQKKTVAKTEKNIFQKHENDTGSHEVQIGLLTSEIAELQWHINANPKDVDAKRSLLKKVAKRRKFLKYLKETKISSYNQISKKLDIKA